MKKRMSTKDIMKRVTDLVVEALDNDVCPWIKPWDGVGSAPYNFESKHEYKGSNVWMLNAVQLSRGYKHNAWVTFNGAKKCGGFVKKGEKSVPVVYWNFVKKEVEQDGEMVEKTIPFLKYFSVWNVEQCGIEVETEELPQSSTLPSAEKVISDYVSREEGLTFDEIEGDRACYIPSRDAIIVPTMAQAIKKALDVGQTEVDGQQHHYSTCFHEMVHSTGHKSRLAREGIVAINGFGTHEYSKEELVAEMGSAVLCTKLGLSSERVMENTKAYCKGWAKKLKSEPSWIVWAGSRSEKAVNYILDDEGTVGNS